jgi:Permuted papain-like amidase enzyme, YaeF/YiiX, C92 family
VSRGGAATSALIARGNDYPGNFSHVALVHVDARTQAVSVIEAHIECGVVVSPIETYLRDTKLRIMVLRLRADLPALVADPQLPHRVAEHARAEATRRHIPYDFAMDYGDPAKQFCSEVASAAYRSAGVNLWMGVSHLSTRGVIAWLSALGVRHFETQEPSDLEYDPQLRVVAEWRDPDTLLQDHVDNAVTDVLLEAAERGEPLDYDLWQLPVGRLLKAYSVVKNWCGAVGPIPEGMSATTALRVQKLRADHAAIQALVLAGAEQFKAGHGYLPPYWELVAIAREAAKRHKARPKGSRL